MAKEKYIDPKAKQKRRQNVWSFSLFLLLVVTCLVIHAWQVKHHHVAAKPVAAEQPIIKATVPAKATTPQVVADTQEVSPN